MIKVDLMVMIITMGNLEYDLCRLCNLHNFCIHVSLPRSHQKLFILVDLFI